MSISATASSRLFGRLREVTGPLEQIGAAVVGFVMSGASIMLTAAPFGVAWAGAAPPDQAIASTVGAMLGYLFLLKGDGTLRYMACLILLLALRWAFTFVSKARMYIFSPLLACATIATTGLAIAISGDGSLYGFVMVFCETAITVTASLLFAKSYRALREGTGLTRTNGVCTGIWLAVMYMGLSAFTVVGVSPARICALAVILCCGYFAGSGFSAATAVTAGLAAALAGEPHLLAVFCAGGLAAGIFAPLGRLGGAAAMTIAAMLALIAQNNAGSATALFIECMVAAAILMVVPSSLLRRLGLARATDSAEGEMIRQVVISQLSRIRHALCDIASVTGQVSEKLDALNGDPIESVLAKACSKICKSCKDSPRCWQSHYEETADALNHVFAAAHSGHQAILADFPTHFKCLHTEKLLAAINDQTGGYLNRRAEKRHAAQMRSVSSDQFSGMGLLLASMQEQLSEYTSAPTTTIDAIYKYLAAKNCEVNSVCCYLDAQQHVSLSIELPLHKVSRLLPPETTADLSEIVSQDLSAPQTLCEGAIARLFWTAKAQYALESAFVQRAANQNRFCGDSCSVIARAQSHAVLLLCDGMGVGSPAAVDATMTTSLLERLLKAGTDFTAALRLVNAALLSGGGEERLCTVDATLLDLYTCRLNIFKAGAAPTYILRQSRCTTVESPSLPAGILSGAKAKHTTLSLSEGDLIIMVSDGLLESGGDWISSQIVALADRSLEQICEALIETATARRITNHEDDMTVMAARVVAA
ncbi:MAG: SpoIIE family protein phosphatase [Candidatus Fimivivens sp.]